MGRLIGCSLQPIVRFIRLRGFKADRVRKKPYYLPYSESDFGIQ